MGITLTPKESQKLRIIKAAQLSSRLFDIVSEHFLFLSKLPVSPSQEALYHMRETAIGRMVKKVLDD